MQINKEKLGIDFENATLGSLITVQKKLTIIGENVMQEVDKISISELKILSERMYEPLVKAVVDIRERKLVVDAALHVDQELYLLEQGSEQHNLWGVNLWPDNFGTDDFVEFDSMVNIRPRDNNRSRSVEDEEIQALIRNIVAEKIYE
jgi:hypothetical protein